MLETLIITFREGLEAFLVIAIMLAYLSNTGRGKLKPAVFAGIAAALIISATTGLHIAELAKNPVWEGTLAIIAGGLVASFTFFLMRNAKNIRGNIVKKLENSAQKPTTTALIGVFIFTVLMIAREGMETALMLGTISANENATNMMIGAIAGFAAVGVIAYLWTSQSHKINLRLFMQVTGVFLILFAINLFLYGIYELSEMNALPFIGETTNHEIHELTEYVGKTWFKNLVTVGLLAVPTIWLGGAWIKDKFSEGKLKTSE